MSRIAFALAFLVGGAAAFTAPVNSVRGSALRAGLSDMVGVGPETGNVVWDPLGFGSVSETINGEHSSVMPHAKWLREAELKHSRGAMLAFVGMMAACTGVSFPGELGGMSYSQPDSWVDGLSSAISSCPFGMAQLFLTIGLIEGTSDPSDFWTGGGAREAGDLGFTPFGKKSGAEMKELQVQELKNGRLAMIAMAAFFAEHQIDGSVPLLSDKI